MCKENMKSIAQSWRKVYGEYEQYLYEEYVKIHI